MSSTETQEQTSYIPEPYCVLDRILKLRDDDNEWTDGWKVVRVGSERVREELLPDAHNEIKHHRLTTGDTSKKSK